MKKSKLKVVDLPLFFLLDAEDFDYDFRDDIVTPWLNEMMKRAECGYTECFVDYSVVGLCRFGERFSNGTCYEVAYGSGTSSSWINEMDTKPLLIESEEDFDDILAQRFSAVQYNAGKYIKQPKNLGDWFNISKDIGRNEVVMMEFDKLSTPVQEIIENLGVTLYTHSLDDEKTLFVPFCIDSVYRQSSRLFTRNESVYKVSNKVVTREEYNNALKNGELYVYSRDIGLRTLDWIENKVTILYENGEEEVTSTVYGNDYDYDFNPDNYPDCLFLCKDDRIAYETEEMALANGYDYCAASGYWKKFDEIKLTANARYHERTIPRVRWNCEEGANFTIGFEVEKEDKDKVKIPYLPLYRATGWVKERDGSLHEDFGYELVSPVYNLMSNRLDMDIENNSDLKRLINGTYNLETDERVENGRCTATCGGHINLASSIYTPQQLLQGLRGFFPMLYSMYAFRLKDNNGNNYSQAKPIHEYSARPEKYSAFFIKKRVLELRLIAAVRDVDNLLWRRDLIRIMVENINKSEREVLKMMLNKRSRLRNHLLKVYSEDKLNRKCKQFIEFCEIYNNVKLVGIKIDGEEIEVGQSFRDEEEDGPFSNSYFDYVHIDDVSEYEEDESESDW